ncbi:AEC family transporter [Peptostreptococcus equinus]|uniref:AEC family transporter n=1 Tax=Peptostreptococcus equinus TaxID=3003601 RepID=A0ABY7JMJ3_9FIRM|nr:AEC family transporter [Peptostreptococcus sp. CBA3647]WAW14315.1 AEC family transporter [Peptostreptococcus sp. CBA3647]
MLVVFTNVLILFMLMYIGYSMGKNKIIKYSSINDLSNILIDFAIPCTIVVSLIRPFNQKLLDATIKVMFLMIIFHLSVALFSYVITKILNVDEKKQGSWMFALVFSNNGFIGYPLMYALYGNDGLFIMAMGNVIQNVFIFSIGIKMVTLNYPNDEKINIKKIVFTRQNIAVIIGMFLFVLQIHVPTPIFNLLRYVSNLTVPLSMMVVGLSLSKYNPKTMFTDPEVYRLSFIRMILLPIFLIIIYKLFKIEANNNLPYAILFFTAALPSPAFTSIMAERYNTSVEFASKCVFITTILSIITVPFFASLL